MNVVDSIAVSILRHVTRTGRLTVTTPNGKRSQFGPGGVGPGGVSADIEVVDRRAWRKLAFGGNLGFAESYMDGWIETTDLRALTAWGAANQDAWSHEPGRFGRLMRRVWQMFPHRQHAEVETMVDHYNLGNDFYASWLDDTMTYSSARFSEPEMSLEDAQVAKYRSIADIAQLEPGMSVLEIGTGWGGFAEFAARRGCRVVTVTISKEQAEYAEKRIADAGLADLVDVRLQDFRKVDGEFDRVVSIEMIESISEDVWPDLFGKIAQVLRPGGRAAMQAITIDDALFETYRNGRDFIQRYVFPGGQLPSVSVIRRLASANSLRLEESVWFGEDYARTLASWYERFERAWPGLQEDLDDRFRRMWLLYLAYCEAGFVSGRINVGQLALSKRG